MELQEALLQISAIRHQMARSEQFRGYRAAPVAVSGLIAIAAGLLQPILVPHPRQHLDRFLTLWIAVALTSMVVCLGDVWRRYRRSAGMLHQETTHLAVGQFFPCLIAGGLLTVVISRSAPDVAWILPGLWSILFGLGLFASWRLLPRAIFAVAVYYLLAGLCAVAWGRGESALGPWTMPLLFGIGQLLAAAVLLLSEREQGIRP
jgi:hypothetical protein